MDTPQDLLEAICNAPDDDDLRERYAKLVEEADPPHAELIRLQVARAADERARGVVRSEVHAGREVGLVSEHGKRWSGYLSKLLVDDRCAFVRGFIGHADVAIENVVGMGKRLWDFAPIQHLDVIVDPFTSTGPVERLFSVPGLERLDSLSLVNAKLDSGGAEILARTPGLARASWLDLGHNQIGRKGVVALATAMANKVIVRLDQNPWNPVEEPTFDYDGTLLDIANTADADEIEREVGHPVPWLRYRWKGNAVPDRYHTRHVKSG